MLGRLFYAFTGVHSFLIGLFPFYIPVYLYTIGLTLSRICLFVAATGMGYCLTLFLWDRVCRKFSFSTLIVWSFFSEYFLLSLFFIENELWLVVLAGFVNGVFNCSFWTIQRLLFVKSISPENSGRNFGNSQLFVLVVLKVGILLGGYFLEQWGFLVVYLFSGIIVLLSAVIFYSRIMTAPTAEAVKLTQPLGISAVFRFKDTVHSRWVFVIDGVFLYLESYFWVISLFIIVRESFLRLSLIVIMLAVFFGVIFLFIKNSIDRLPRQKVYVAAVTLYA
jgi:MFS family permease